MRLDTEHESETHVYIYDLEAGKRYRLDAKRKEVFVMDLAGMSERWRGSVMSQNLRKVIKPTGQKLEIAGVACDEYTFDLQAPTRPWRGLSSVLHDHGTVCVSQSVPAGIDVVNFVHEAGKRGYVAAATICSPTASAIGYYFYGDQPNVLVLSSKTESAYEGAPSPDIHAMTAVENTTTVTSISVDSIQDAIFQIPTDWKLKKEPDPR